MKRLTFFRQALAASCFLLMAVDTSAAALKQLPISDYFKDSVLRDATLSPSGRYVLVTDYPSSALPYVMLIDLKAQISAPVVKAGLSQEYFSGIGWISDDTAVLYDHIGSGFKRLIVMKWSGMIAGQPQVKLTTWPADFWIPNVLIYEGDEMLIARKTSWNDHECTCVYRVDTNLGPAQLHDLKPLYVLDPDTTSILTDKTGKPVVIETVDDKHVRHYLRDTSAAGQTAKWEQFKQLTDKDQVFDTILVAPDGHDLIVLSNIGRDTVACFTFDPGTGKFLSTLYANDHYDVVAYHDDAWTDKLTYLTWYMGTSPNYQIMDSRAGLYMAALHKAFPSQQVVPWNISEDGKTILVYVYSDTNAGAYYALNIATHQAELLGVKRPWLDPALMSSVTSGSIRTSDGFDIAYLLALPKSGQAPYPMVVIPHGGPIGVFNVDSFDNELQLLTSRGYAVLKINYRGSGGSGTKFQNAGKHQFGLKIEDDIRQVVQVTLKSAPVDKNRICIFGASYGGYSALMSVIRDPALYKCAASYAGVTDLPLLYDTTNVEFDQEVRDAMADIIGDPTTDSAKLRAVSPVYLAAKIERPVFLAQGGQDTRVDEEQAYRLKLVMDALHKPLEFQVYPDEIHGFEDQKDEVDFYTRLLKFLDQNIGTPPAAMEKSSSG